MQEKLDATTPENDFGGVERDLLHLKALVPAVAPHGRTLRWGVASAFFVEAADEEGADHEELTRLRKAWKGSWCAVVRRGAVGD